MAGAPSWWLAATPPVGPVYSLVLLAHVAAAVVGFGSVGVTGLMAVRARRGPQSSDAEAVRRFFRAPVNWPSRTIYLVPVLGVSLLVLSQGAFDVDDHFVIIGLAVWVVSVAVAETVVWPAERRVVAVVRSWGGVGEEASFDPLTAAAAGSAGSAGSVEATSGVPWPAVGPVEGPAASASASASAGAVAGPSALDRQTAARQALARQAFERQAFERDCRLLELGAVLLVVLFIGVAWAMVAKP